jgi:hypothetical protein
MFAAAGRDTMSSGDNLCGEGMCATGIMFAAGTLSAAVGRDTMSSGDNVSGGDNVCGRDMVCGSWQGHYEQRGQCVRWGQRVLKGTRRSMYCMEEGTMVNGLVRTRC